jgi:hypothetical protein
MARAPRIGVRVDDEWYCSAACVARVATERLRDRPPADRMAAARPSVRLGALMVHQGAISHAQLHEALDTQRRSGRRLGAEVEHRGFADRRAVLRALAAQDGASYLTTIDLTALRHVPRGLSEHEVRALGVVPLGAVARAHQDDPPGDASDERRTTDADAAESPEDAFAVAYAAPLPRAAIGALAELTGGTPIPYLVSDDDLARVTEAYVAAARQAPPSVASTPRDLREAGRRIADAAAAERSVRLTEAHVDPFTLIRVTGQHATHSLVLSSRTREVPAWLAGITLH